MWFSKRPPVAVLVVPLCALLIPFSVVAQTPTPTSSLIVKLVPGLSGDEQAAAIMRICWAVDVRAVSES